MWLGSLQRSQSRLCHDRSFVPYLNQSQLDQCAEVIVLNRRQLEPIAKDVSKGPAKGNGCFEVEVCKWSFHHDVEKMNDPRICSTEKQFMMNSCLAPQDLLPAAAGRATMASVGNPEAPGGAPSEERYFAAFSRTGALPPAGILVPLDPLLQFAIEAAHRIHDAVELTL